MSSSSSSSSAYCAFDFAFGGPPQEGLGLCPATGLPPATLDMGDKPNPSVAEMGALLAGKDLESYAHDISRFDCPDGFMTVAVRKCATVDVLLNTVVFPALLELPCSFVLDDAFKEVSVSAWAPRRGRVQFAVRVYNELLDGPTPGFRLSVFRRAGDAEDVLAAFGQLWGRFEVLGNGHGSCTALDAAWVSILEDDDVQCTYCQLVAKKEKLPFLSVEEFDPPVQLHMHMLVSFDQRMRSSGAAALLEYFCPETGGRPCVAGVGLLRQLNQLLRVVSANDPYDHVKEDDGFAMSPSRDVFVNVVSAVSSAVAGACELNAALVTPAVVEACGELLPRLLRYVHRFEEDMEGVRHLVGAFVRLLSVPLLGEVWRVKVTTSLRALRVCVFLRPAVERALQRVDPV